MVKSIVLKYDYDQFSKLREMKLKAVKEKKIRNWEGFFLMLAEIGVEEESKEEGKKQWQT